MTSVAQRQITPSPSSENTDYAQHLVNTGLLTAQELKIVQYEQKLTPRSLRKILLDASFISEEGYLKWSCKEVEGIFYEESIKDKIEYDQPTSLYDIADICESNKDSFYDFKIAPLKLDSSKKELSVLITDLLDIEIKDKISRLFKNYKVTFQGAFERTIFQILEDAPWKKEHLKNQLQESINDVFYITEKPTTTSTQEPAENPVQFIDSIIEGALKGKASDIHFSPEKLCVNVSLRIHGDLEKYRLKHIEFWPQILSRLKIMSGMNIAEKRLPQSGRFSLTTAGRDIDFRASTHPISTGENFVLRILDRLHSFMELDELGFAENHIKQIKKNLMQPYGMIIMTGPTGSGKTTTLYSMLSYLKEQNKNIMTLEDPIEYTLPHIRQTQVQPEIDFDFSTGVRSLLRQDPDVLLIGEIRDEDTAKMALRAAMTGHLVLTTLHTNSTLSVPSRLIDLGIDPHLLSGHLNCIISQRLAKRPLNKKRGAKKGRLPLVEVLNVTSELDTLFMRQEPFYVLQKNAEKHGFVSMQQQAKDYIARGDLTIESVQRVLSLEEKTEEETKEQ